MSTVYVSTTGSDVTGDGTLATPYATISNAILFCSNGYTIKMIDGTYTISSTVNINKQVTITSNSGTKTDVILSGSCTIFNVQQNNINITNMTLQTSITDNLITIDSMSTGSTLPTFWDSIVISGCDIKYVKNALLLNGKFTVNNNNFTRNSGTEIADIITIYSTRSICSVSSNTLTDSEKVRYFIYLTSTGSGTYVDRCNSKGGTMNIASNTLTLTNGTQVTTFIYQNYFNKYTYTVADAQYNMNTLVYLTINNNTITPNINGIFMNLVISTNDDLLMFGYINVNANTISATDYGVVHLDKIVNNSIVTISSTSLNRNLFKLYNNVLNTVNPVSVLYEFDSTVSSKIYTNTTVPYTPVSTPGSAIRRWDSSGTLYTLTNLGTVTWVSGSIGKMGINCPTAASMRLVSQGIIPIANRTVFIVFDNTSQPYPAPNDQSFIMMTNGLNGTTFINYRFSRATGHPFSFQVTPNGVSNETMLGTHTKYVGPNIIGFKTISDGVNNVSAKYIDSLGATSMTSTSVMSPVNTTFSSNSVNDIFFGYGSSIIVYNIIVYNGVMSDSDMISTKDSLRTKWGI